MDWLPEAMHVLRDELPNIDVKVSSDYSPVLADGLMRGRLDLAFMRPERHMPDLAYKVVMQEPLLVVLPSDHRLASRKAVSIRDIINETFIGMSKTAPSLQVIIDTYLKSCGVDIRAEHEADNVAMAISLVASTRGVTLMPDYVRNFLPRSVVSRTLEGEPPTIDLVIGYHKVNASPVLRLFLQRSDALIARVANKVHNARNAALT